MVSEFAFRARLRSALAEYISAHDTPFATPLEESPGGKLLVPSPRRGGIIFEIVPADVDPHSPTVIRKTRRRACNVGASAFVTVSETDAFLFYGSEPDADRDGSEFDRRWYDLRTLSLATFGERVLADAVVLRDDDEAPGNDEEFMVGRCRSFHASLVPRYESRIGEAFANDDEFRGSLLSWARKNDYPVARPEIEETFRTVARRYAYLVMARLVLADRGRKDDGAGDGEVGSVFAEMSAAQERSGLFGAIPTDEGTKERLRAFAASIEGESLSTVERDIAGRMYERLIPDDERTALGQFYTPDEIGRLLSRWAVRSPTDRVLDPASGTGSLTVHAYERLDELGSCSHRELLSRLTAVDINEVPLHLTALNLASRNGYERSDESVVYHGDFFDFDPDDIGPFDATVANPPYVRQEALAADRAHFRDHLERFGRDAGGAYADGEKEIDGRSDLYCYFLTHVTGFLREGARLAWVLPTKWMTADYGPSLQEFLYDHYKVEAVVGFRNRLFEDALVDTVLLLLERTDDAEARRTTETNFVRINERMDPEDALAVIDRTEGIREGTYLKIRGESSHRTIAVRQSHLEATLGEKLQRYITAPTLYTAVVEYDATVPLSDLATITRGKKTGANPVFILDADEVRSRTIEGRFLRPAVKSVREVDGYEHTADDAERWMLDMADYVAGVVSNSGTTETDERTTETDRATLVASSLERDGYDGVSSYLRWAATQPSRSNASLANNDPWFDMGPLDAKTAPIVCPQAMDTRRRFLRTDGNVVASNRFLLVRPKRVDSTLLLGLLNSSLSKIVVESHGRVTGGGAVNLSGSDLRTLRVVDPTALTEEQRTAARNGFEALAAGDERGQTVIDDVVIDVLGLDVDAETLGKIARTLKETRRAKGTDVEPLIRGLDALDGEIEMEFDE
ncbi:class I SAM-dependent DNA methyltransferase [Haladaptatus sp. CMAA 1911]|uniref:HsdM family class I SAM-dependent methyltransferase n=1 Tax=unclassified Haladaptatus TaxID=2622732 RepID=UPI003753EF64